MSHRVIYIDRKSGKPASATFGTLVLAEAYAKTVKGARVESCDTAAPVVDVTRCPDGTAEAQRAATRSFYKPVNLARKGVLSERTIDTPEMAADYEAELMAEHFAGALAAGQSREDAFADWDFIRGYGR